ncbi:phage portal protein [Mycolicibacterium palauense]|uniref:phage portal protein n=1 Tax=Mycolicibacterium palauense TaxID=2034511 RepID=UPI001FEA8BB1|nr:phage portal protein [Mycolicibacterium palauense]
MRLLDRLLGRLGGATRGTLTLEQYSSMLNQFTYDGWAYPGGVRQTLAGTGTEKAPNNFEGLATHAYQANGVIFACMLVRMLVFSSVRFQWQRLYQGKPSDTFGTRDLTLFEEPWVGGTTQDLLTRMIQDADLAGNSYWYAESTLATVGSQEPKRELVRLRPDWVQIIGLPRIANRVGRNNANRGGGQIGWRKIGYLYTENGGGSQNDEVPFTVDEVAHFAPIPDPLGVFIGMSWLTPIIREIQADQSMTRYQQKFMDNGATPNIIVKHFPGLPGTGGSQGIAGATLEGVQKWVEEFDDKYSGVDRAGKTMHLYPGADATVVGSNLKDIEFKVVRGHGETRIAAAAGAPPVIVGLSEGLEAATYANYAQARRRFADGTIHPLWQNASGSLQRVAKRPEGSRLWYDSSDVPFLREDEKDAAEIAEVKARTIRTYVDGGYEPASVIAAVEANDLRLLKHTGWYSVQLQQPGAQQAISAAARFIRELRGASEPALRIADELDQLAYPPAPPALPPADTKEDR